MNTSQEHHELKEKPRITINSSMEVVGHVRTENLNFDYIASIKEQVCGCIEGCLVPLIVQDEFIRRLYENLAKRGIKIQYVTEVTKENIDFCKYLTLKFGIELRHLDGVNGNFSISDYSGKLARYWTIDMTTGNDGEKKINHFTVSSATALVEQNQSVFRTLWGKSISSETKFREIEDGGESEISRAYSGKNDVLRALTSMYANAKGSYSSCYRPSTISNIFAVPEYYSMIQSLRDRGIKLRLVTEINEQNIDTCKRISKELGCEVHHLDGISAGFSVSEDEYVCFPDPPQNAFAAQIFYSNAQGIVRQNQFVFEMLWSRSITLDERDAQLRLGKEPTRTILLTDPNEIVRESRKALETAVHQCSLSNSEALSVLLNHFKSSLERIARSNVGGSKFLLQIKDASDAQVVKKALQLGVDVRHIDFSPEPPFAITDSKLFMSMDNLTSASVVSHLLVTNEPLYVEQYSKLFQRLWNERSVDVHDRIRELEEGIPASETRIIKSPSRIKKEYFDLVTSARESVVLILPTISAFQRAEVLGIIEQLERKATEDGLDVRILSPIDSKLKKDSNSRTIGATHSREIIFSTPVQMRGEKSTGIVLREINSESDLVGPSVTMLIVDRKRALVIEIKADSEQRFESAIGLATYTSNKSSVDSYLVFFDRLWHEYELREMADRNKAQAELLQDILTHDIRNYNQVTKLSAELLAEEVRENDEVKPIVHNLLASIDGTTELLERAKKLGRIVSEIQPKLYPVDISTMSEKALALAKSGNPEKKVIHNSRCASTDLESSLFNVNPAFCLADDLLFEVFLNLYSNSIKYSQDKEVSIETSIESPSSEYWKISITDTGKGMPDAMKGNVFSRYLAGARGSGLGLSIVHALVVGRYKGSISIMDRVQGDSSKGTCVEIILPRTDLIEKMQSPESL